MDEQNKLARHCCAIVSALLCQVNIGHILTGEVSSEHFSCEDVGKLLVQEESYRETRTELECRNLTESLNHYMKSMDNSHLRYTKPGELNFFELLGDTVEKLLLVDNGEVVCRYRDILQWRGLVQNVGEEIPVSAMYVISDLREGRTKPQSLDWDYVIGHNNEPLNKLLNRGISDHHFHLLASMPYFQVSWVNLMNDLLNEKYERGLDKIDKEDWSLREAKPKEKQIPPEKWNRDRKDSLSVLRLQAALIRVYLCTRLAGGEIMLSKIRCEEEKIEEIKETLYKRLPRKRQEEIKKAYKRGLTPQEKARIKADLRRELTRQEIEGIQKAQVQVDINEVYSLLNSPLQLRMMTRQIQSMITALQGAKFAPCIDYAHRIIAGAAPNDSPVLLAYAGERWFLYSVLKDTYVTYPKLRREEHDLFYIYLTIQLKLRKKLLQVEKQIGFDYFQKIQRRKSYFITDSRSIDLAMKLAIYEPLERHRNIVEVEARISPSESAEEMRKRIEKYDQSCENNTLLPLNGCYEVSTTRQQEIKTRYYYVFHFQKRADQDRLGDAPLIRYRHASYRDTLERITEAILKLRKEYPREAERVLGIDACSQEIGCRPEIFGYIFRLLNHDTCHWNDGGIMRTLPKLKMTYHVGEDFLDLVDGMRAIDEAVRFLNLDCGDRLGHAMALCLSPKQWYEDKKYQVFMPVQDYLDDVTWLYHCIHHYHLRGLQEEARFLKKEFQHYFKEIYLKHLYEERPDRITPDHERIEYTIDDYIRSWMLRGDHPILYRNGCFEENEILKRFSAQARWKKNERFPADSTIRQTTESVYLNYCYHYNRGVRITGAEKRTLTIDERYIRAAVEVQRCLQFDIAKRGITIESNPTSNLRISPMKSYHEHPITNIFNQGLYHSDERLRACPQIPFSINTDDSGLFFTSLGNEYAVMAQAAEMTRTEDGEERYMWEIYEWLDAVRRNGNEQSFQS